MMSSLEGTVRWGSNAAGDFYSIFDNSVVTSEIFLPAQDCAKLGSGSFHEGPDESGKPNLDF